MRAVRVSDFALEAGAAWIERELVQLAILQEVPDAPLLGLSTDQTDEILDLARWRGLRFAEDDGRESVSIAELWRQHARVTVIVACHNYGHYLDEAVRSVLAQSYLPDEIILSDDASTDESPAIMESYQRSNPDLVRVNLNASNLGIRAHFNKVVSMATGDLVLIIGADNRIPVDYVESQLATLAIDDQVGLAYTDFALFGGRAKNDYERMRPDFRGAKLPGGVFMSSFPQYSVESAVLLREGHNFIHGSTMYRKAVWEQVGGYRDRADGPEDMTLFQAMLGTGLVAKKVLSAALEYRQHSAEQANYQFSYFGELQRLREEKAIDLARIEALLERNGELERRHGENDQQLLKLWDEMAEGQRALEREARLQAAYREARLLIAQREAEIEEMRARR